LRWDVPSEPDGTHQTVKTNYGLGVQGRLENHRPTIRYGRFADDCDTRLWAWGGVLA
jgi:hypothetical protein